jgi:hypothetical protein
MKEKILHTKIKTEKHGRNVFTASCYFKPENGKYPAIEYYQKGTSEQEAIEKMKAVLSGKGDQEIVEVEAIN